MAALDFVKMYLDELVQRVISTASLLEDNLNKLMEVFSRLQEVGLKINANHSKLFALD